MKPDLAALLEAMPRGKRLWMTTRGSSLWPLVRGGARLEVERCDVSDLARGDLAVLSTEQHALVAHVVVSTAPLRTESFRGTPDPAGWRVLGRARAPLPRPVVWLAQRSWSAVARRKVAQLAVSALLASVPRQVRATALGHVELRAAASREEAAVALALERPISDDEVDVAPVIVAVARGAIVGFAQRDHIWVARRAQDLGLAERLLTLSRTQSSHPAD